MLDCVFGFGCPGLFLRMFVRRKKNRSGVISIQIIDKSTGNSKVVKTIGNSSDPSIIEILVKEGEEWISKRKGELFFDFYNEHQLFTSFANGIQQIHVSGTEQLLGKLYEEIGFHTIDDDLLKKLVIARLCFPVSKLKTIDFLNKYHGIDVAVDRIYRYLDKLNKTQKEAVQKISYEHTVRILNNQISMVFYDVTTLYFEIDDEDDLRKTGFSKDGKHQHPQIVLGLLVSVNGYPLAYDIFEGNKFEGHTMLPVINSFKKSYGLDKLVIVADAGLLSNENIEQLTSQGYEYILGARIKSESKLIKEKMLSLKLKNGDSAIVQKEDATQLVISYSDARAKKDKANREKGLLKLEKQIKAGRLTKTHINNKGYNKYLKLEGDINVSIDKTKAKADEQWDGLKGYVTNTKLSKEEIIENYGHLWKIEKAFRISKTDLKIRPIFHRLQRRIEAHICIAFIAYKIYKELERQLHIKESHLSPEKAIEIAKTIYTIQIITPNTKEKINKTLILNDEQKYLTHIFGL